MREFLFEPPKYDLSVIQNMYNKNNAIVSKIEKGISLSAIEHEAVFKLPNTYLICYLNGFLRAPEKLKKAKDYIKKLDNKNTYIRYKETYRVLRKIKYN